MDNALHFLCTVSLTLTWLMLLPHNWQVTSLVVNMGNSPISAVHPMNDLNAVLKVLGCTFASLWILSHPSLLLIGSSTAEVWWLLKNYKWTVDIFSIYFNTQRLSDFPPFDIHTVFISDLLFWSLWLQEYSYTKAQNKQDRSLNSRFFLCNNFYIQDEAYCI